MGRTARSKTASGDPTVLSIDIGGSHIKILTSAGGTEHRADSGPDLTPQQMIDAVKALADGLSYDVVSMGYPGPVHHNRPLLDPANLGKGWAGFDFAAQFGRPVKVVNDALMQAIGSYEGGRMLFLGLGTGLGAAMIVDNVAQPMELAHLPYKKGKSFEDYVGERGLVKRGKKKWRKSVFDVVERLRAAMQPDYVVIGGGNVDKLDDLPADSRRGDNTRAFEGGFRLWRDKALIV
ncbi:MULTISPECIES: ROK family protein [unclassified Mesorhizobium]|uniref:ROK family protein n=1 Tax=unclassified Mesorhizobium TaxID=325217 RepID=UPI0011282820|nr:MULTISPECIES: ROK family protein [unclassified Mesorhizobium]MBZ9806661.1 ROK family protein [Mesorhizobium sp. ESP-6-2]TPM24503.1 ROK family protein [Mesorhizobium sp. B2-2-2]